MNEDEVVDLVASKMGEMIAEALQPKWIKDARSSLGAARAAVQEAARHLDRVAALIERNAE